jgi:hypothetical protein
LEVPLLSLWKAARLIVTTLRHVATLAQLVKLLANRLDVDTTAIEDEAHQVQADAQEAADENESVDED